MNSKCVLSDSGTITEESSILGFNAINIREAHERPEGMEEASVMMLGLKKDRVIQGIEMLCSTNNNNLEKSKIVYDYSSKNISDKIIKIIYSYTDYVCVVWKKY